jgi:predicted RNA-binding protein YlxR (DUF448 family)
MSLKACGTSLAYSSVKMRLRKVVHRAVDISGRGAWVHQDRADRSEEVRLGERKNGQI